MYTSICKTFAKPLCLFKIQDVILHSSFYVSNIRNKELKTEVIKIKINLSFQFNFCKLFSMQNSFAKVTQKI